MKGHITVSKLSKKKFYVSELDYDKSFQDKGNPKGYFKMLIEPIENCDGEHEIRYMKKDSKYIISGEAYIITGNSEQSIDNKVKKLVTIYDSFKQTEVKSENDLW